MPDAARPRLGLQAIAGSDLLNTIDTTSDAQMDIIDLLAARFEQGSLASQPPSTPGTPGIEGRFYWATDTSELYLDHGTGWKRVWPPEPESVTADMLTDAIVSALGLNDAEGVRRGKSIIATEESRSNAAYGTLTTPDRVENVVLPTDGLIVVRCQAAWKESVSAAARAAIFVGANQLKAAHASFASPLNSEAAIGAVNAYTPLVSSPIGLSSAPPATAYAGDVTTGQAVAFERPSNVNAPEAVYSRGGACYIFAAAGVYTVSVQFKASSGSVTAKDRKLWVSTLGF